MSNSKVIKGKQSNNQADSVQPGSVFKKVVEDEKEEYILVNGELVPKPQKEHKIQEMVEQDQEAEIDERVESELAKRLAEMPNPKDLDDGTPLGKMKAKKAQKALEEARKQARQRVQRIVSKRKTALTKIGNFDEFAVVVEEAADLYPRCDFEVGEHQVNYNKGTESHINERYFVKVIRPNGDTRNMSISAKETTFEHLIQFLDEAAV